MSTNSKTFRLFISSTFNDFRREREVLQTKVFPHIKEYASAKGYTFQPIDLRWGVSNEAQLDQKTLELCLNEVRACKTHMHPNFLIMIGDRYGWVPLPYAIEIEEFEVLLSFINDKDTKVLLEWYQKDLNQLPSSYILKERREEYEEFEVWIRIEDKLRSVLQSAVHNSKLNEQQKRKYFLSATEAEVEEGIIPYIKLTKYQENVLLSKNSFLQAIDQEHIFAFFRDVDKSTKQENKFIVDDYNEAQIFKEHVCNVIENENTLHVKTRQIDKERLEESYLKEFEERMVKFLESQVETQKVQETKEKLTCLEIELQDQSYFAENKRKDFLAQENLREIIQNYVIDNNQQSLIIYGPSGRGKSSLMAKAIQETEDGSDKKVIYRFVGATPNSGSSKEILISLFAELKKDVSFDENKETFEQFSERIHTEVINLKEDIVIFIDAVDQLDNDDQFLWLPRQLPSNIKIIISALDDEKYLDDSKYFKTLKTKTGTIYEIPIFSKPKELLSALLHKEDRTLQDEQESYFLKQFDSAKSPLYVSVAVQELKNWKSSDYTDESSSKINGTKQELQPTQKGIIKEFIENLSKVYHHNEKFVLKVLGYIYGSRDGLSESELLQLLSCDSTFIEEVTPETFHENITKDLPLIHWSRLHTQLKVFLSQKLQDNESLMYFFHREFEDVIKILPRQQLEHEAVITATQSLILQFQDKDFEANRWGKLYVILITEYELRYKNKKKQKEYAEFIVKLNYDEWIESCLNNIHILGNEHYLHNRMYKAIAFQESHLHSRKVLFENDGINYSQGYIRALNNLATSYKYQNRQNEAINLEEISLEISKTRYQENTIIWAKDYTITLNNLARSYYNQNRLEEAIALEEASLKISKILYQEDSTMWAKDYTRILINLARSYYNQNRIEGGVLLLEESLEIRKQEYAKNPIYWAGYYTIALNDLAYSYKELNRVEEAIVLEKEALKIRKKLYKKKPSRWSKDYTRSLNNLATSYKYQNKRQEAMVLEEESYKISKALYQDNSSRWAKDYTIALNNLAYSYYESHILDEAVILGEEALQISIKLYKDDPSRWVEFYIRGMNDLALIYKAQNLQEKAFILQETSYIMCKKLYQDNPSRWVKDYIIALNNFATTHKNNNQQDETIKLLEESLLILKQLCQENPERWEKHYIKAMDSLLNTQEELK